MKPENHKELLNLDRVRKMTSQNFRRFDEDTRMRIEEMYPEGKDFAKLIREDRSRFEDAMENAGVPGRGEEPVRALFNQFISDLDLNSVAAGLGVDPEDFKTKLSYDSETRQILMRLEDEGVKRQLYLSDFRSIVRLTGIGSVRESRPLAFPFFGQTEEAKPQPNQRREGWNQQTRTGQSTGVSLIDEDHFGGELKVVVQTSLGQKHYEEEDVIECEIVANSDCFVSVFAVDPEGKVVQLVPNEFHPQGLQIRRNEKMVFPTDAMGFKFRASPPHGRTILKAIATKQPIKFNQQDVRHLESVGLRSNGDGYRKNEKSIRVTRADPKPQQHRNTPATSLNDLLPANEWATSRFTIVTHSR